MMWYFLSSQVVASVMDSNPGRNHISGCNRDVGKRVRSVAVRVRSGRNSRARGMDGV